MKDYLAEALIIPFSTTQEIVFGLFEILNETYLVLNHVQIGKPRNLKLDTNDL